MNEEEDRLFTDLLAAAREGGSVDEAPAEVKKRLDRAEGVRRLLALARPAPTPTQILGLIRQEMAVRAAAGESIQGEEYLRRFPEHGERLRALLANPEFSLTPDHTVNTRRPGPAAAPSLPVVPGYEVIEELGRGGMGVVYKARQLGLNRLVALKLLLHPGAIDEERRRRFRTEAEAAARLSHANLVQVFEVGEHEGCPFLAMELCEGGSLARRLAVSPLSAMEAARLVEALARAMATAHAGRVVHRDLKPANVLLTFSREPLASASSADALAGGSRLNECTAKIADFGLARQLDDAGLTQTGQILGTPSYMAPEQAAGSKEVGPAADVYGLGAILYECLTGRPPFKAATTLQTLLQVQSQEPVAPRLLAADVPRDLDSITLKCLEKEPRRRYATAEDLADDLRRYLDHRPVRARPLSAPRRLGRWARRNRLLSALLAVVLAAAATLGGQWYRFTLDLAEQRDRADEHADKEHEQAEEAQRQSRLAVANLVKARQTAYDFYLTVRDNEELKGRGNEALRTKMLQQAMALQEQLIEDYGELPELHAQQARCYQLLGAIAADVHSSKEAIAYLRKAVAIDERLAAADPDNVKLTVDLSSSSNDLSYHLDRQGQKEEARKLARRSIDGMGRVVAAETDPKATFNRFNLARSKLNFGAQLRREKRYAEAEKLYNSARSDAEECVRRNPLPDHIDTVAMCFNNLAVLYKHTGRKGEAVEKFQEAIRIRGDLVEFVPNYTDYELGLARACSNLAALQAELKRDREAEELYRRAIEVQSRLVERHPKARTYRVELANYWEAAGKFYRDRQRSDDATEALRQAKDQRQAIASLKQ